jgi:hypothetical protein
MASRRVGGSLSRDRGDGVARDALAATPSTRPPQRQKDAATHLQQRDQVVDVLDLVVGHEDFGVHELAELPFLVVDEVRAYITSVYRETFRELDFVVQSLRLFEGRRTSSSHFFVGLGNHAAHEGVARRTDRGNI